MHRLQQSSGGMSTARRHAATRTVSLVCAHSTSPSGSGANAARTALAIAIATNTGAHAARNYTTMRTRTLFSAATPLTATASAAPPACRHTLAAATPRTATASTLLAAVAASCTRPLASAHAASHWQRDAMARNFHAHARIHSDANAAAAAAAAASTQQQQQQQQQQRGSQQEEEQRSESRSESRSSSASWNPFRAFVSACRRAFDWYASKLDSHPVKTQSLTSGFLFLIGDMTAQRYEHRLDLANGIDVSGRPYVELLRLAACTSFGLFVLGPCGHWWYSGIDVFTNKLYAPRSWKNVGMKVLLDTAIFNPIFLIVFFTSVSLLEGLTLKDIGFKLYRDFVPSYAVDCSIWPPIQTINFRIVPVKFQLLVVNLGCYFDDVFLSYVQHNGMPWMFQRIEHAWLEYIGDANHAAAMGLAAAKAKDAAGAETEAEAEGEGEEEAASIVEVLPHPASKSAQAATVVLVPSSQKHPHHPHTHPVAAGTGAKGAPLPHHHVVPKALAESERGLHRVRGVDVHLVQELDADWTDVPADQAEAAKAEAKAEQANKKQQQKKKE